MHITSSTVAFLSLWFTACGVRPDPAPGQVEQPLDSSGTGTALGAGKPSPDTGDTLNEPGGGGIIDAGGDKPSGGGTVSDGGTDDSSIFVTGPLRLRDALQTINDAIRLRHLPATILTVADIKSWFKDGEYFRWTKAERLLLNQQLAIRHLPAGWTLSLEQIVGIPGDPWRINLCGPQPTDGSGWRTCNTISEGTRIAYYLESARTICQDGSRNLCEENFVGALPLPVARPLPAYVPIRVEAIQVPGEAIVPEYAVRDALNVSVRLTARSIPALVDYFGVGYDRAALHARLRRLLDKDPSKWVYVQEFLFGWVSDRANTFPAEGENEVCHGVARQFYSDILHNESGYDRSTEAVDVLLHDHYCRITDNALPGFGDYLYAPGAHSARYILRAPNGRDIVFSVQSGGMSAYRFYWADEDMSLDPFGHTPLPDYRQSRVDVWRRCR